jgi:glycine/D-amino acid oxidase-like deaminating enzyme
MYGSLDDLPRSFWQGRPAPPRELETVVVGGGLVGLSTAYWLAQGGCQVTVLEAGALAGRASGRNAGSVLTGSPEPFVRLAHRLGKGRALAFWHLSEENRELLRQEILDSGKVECGFQGEGSWIVSLAGSGQEELLEESGELLRQEGFEVEWRSASGVARASGAVGLGGGLFQARDGGLDPLRLCRGLATLGGFEVATGTRVRGIAAWDGRVHLVTDGGEILAERVALAVNAYIPSLLPQLAPEVRPVRAQVLATAPTERSLSGVWYLDNGSQQVRQLADGTVLFGGCRDRAEATEVGYVESPTATVQGALEETLTATFPTFADLRVVRRWAGTLAFTADGLPRVAAVPHIPGAYYAAGFHGHGLSLGFAVGRYLARWVSGEGVEPLWGRGEVPRS